ncbi:MAG: bifunctional methylenetetrahydrofolate dehydrogenase/methenyltetrahydrofolate cyclohydrolase FolD [Candidatus Margulisbacteria bacterium]|nr:bifunctional methylenetetrahydrofolate dehydrogenase/methenyltetrahydrofolate cyclohydrolase FolD [Candidatus Margulisiibacteriota bacterium]
MDNKFSKKIIDGKLAAAQIKQEVIKQVKGLKKRGITPGLTVIIVGENQASQVYVRNKEKDASEVGFKSEVIKLDKDISEQKLLQLIKKLNSDKTVHGLLVQLPLPRHINESKVINTISPEKDVDGFHPINIGKLVTGDETGFVSCTPGGIIWLLKSAGIDLEGKEAVIVGRSNIVGKPMIHLLLRENATVTVCHSRTVNLAEVCKRADVLIAAVGKSRLIKKEFVKKGAVVVDVGINREEKGLCGDVDCEEVMPFVSRITPVPGGVGPMTRAMLLLNTIKAVKLQNGLE